MENNIPVDIQFLIQYLSRKKDSIRFDSIPRFDQSISFEEKDDRKFEKILDDVTGLRAI